MEIKSVAEQVREMEAVDKSGFTTISKYVKLSPRENIDRTEAYYNSKHISGDKDAKGRKKPFANVVVPAANIWFRATDIDRNKIIIRPKKQKNAIEALLMTFSLQNWMEEENFGQFLNDWGLASAIHNSVVNKFIEQHNELSAQVISWNNLLFDAIDFKNNIKIEKLWFTPAQLKKKKEYDQDMVDDLLDNLTSRKTIGDQQQDNKDNYILVYEVHGELPLSLLTDKESDEDTYVQQMHIITYQAKKSNSKEFDEYTLFSGREAKDPYYLSHLLKKDGQSYAGGAVMNLFEVQTMMNHLAKQIKDILDLGSKIVLQTSDPAFQGKNMTSNIDTGDVLKHEPHQPVTRLDITPNIVASQSFMSFWQSLGDRLNGISEAMQGDNPPSGTAWRQTQALLQESHSLFELMTENKGLALIEMLKEYVLPFFKKQLNHSNEIPLMLDEAGIKQIDSLYIPNEVMRRLNRKKIDTVLSGQIYDPSTEATDAVSAQAEIQQNLQGNQRFISPSDIDSKTWKEVFKDVGDDVYIDVTGEAKDVKGAMDTLTSLLESPAIQQDIGKQNMIINRILSLSGTISPLELQLNSSPPPQVAQPQEAPGAQQPQMVMGQ